MPAAPVFDQLLSRVDAAGVLPPEEVAPLIQAAAAQSVALSLFRTVRMGTLQTRVPVLEALGQAYWVNGDTGLKQTTDVRFGASVLTAEEIAVIVPIPNAVIDDSSQDIWRVVRPLLAQRFGRVIDLAVLAGINRPASFSPAIVPTAVFDGNVATAGAPAEEGGVLADLALVFDLVEADGFDVSGVAAARPLRGLLRGARDSTGQPLMDRSSGLTTVEGQPVVWAGAGVLGTALAVVGDWSCAVLGIRQDISFDLSRDGVIVDETGKVILSALQQDCTLLRAVMRIGFATAVPATDAEEGSGTPYPFAVLEPEATP